MFGKFMNSYFYGKSGKGDLTHEDLPETRSQLFWETLRTRFSGLVRLNLLYMISWIPVLLVIGYHLLLFYSATVSLADMQSQFDAGTLTAVDFAAQQSQYVDGIKAIALRALLFLIPALAVTGPFTAGICLVTRNWARDEHAFLWSDFMDAVKENWKHGLITSTITGFVPLLVYVCWAFYGQMAETNTLYIVPQVLTLLLGLIWLMSLMFIYPMIVTYRLRYRDVLRNSMLLTIGRLPATVGLKLLSLVPVLIAAVVSFLTPYFQWALMICIIYYMLLGLALSRFVGASYTNAVFDKYINVKIDGAQVNRGLYVDTEEDEENEDAGSNPQP
jgi:uncharacterized membrane protein YesL